MKFKNIAVLSSLTFLQCTYSFRYGSIRKMSLMQEGKNFLPNMKIQEIVYCGKTSFEKSDNTNNPKNLLLDGLFDKVKESFPEQKIFENIQIEIIPGNDFLLPCAYFRIFKSNEKKFSHEN